MKIKVKETQRIEKVIDVEFPYYYKYIWGECEIGHHCDVSYGKMIGKTVYCIQEVKGEDGSCDYDLEKINITNYHEDYFKEENQSTKEEFEAVVDRALKSLKEYIK